jgi:quinol monooxygenase YgiN
MTKPSVFIKFIAQPGKRDALVAHLTSVGKASEAEIGTEAFSVHISPIDSNAVFVYELYTDAKAKEAHESTSSYAFARAKTGEMLAGPPEVFPLIAVGGK